MLDGVFDLNKLNFLYVDGNILTGAIPTEMQKLHKIRMLNIGKTLESYRNDYFFCHIHDMHGLNISSKYVPLDSDTIFYHYR